MLVSYKILQQQSTLFCLWAPNGFLFKEWRDKMTLSPHVNEVSCFLFQLSLQERTLLLRWKQLCSLKTPENRCRLFVLANTWRCWRNSLFILQRKRLFLVPFIWSFSFPVYSLTRRPSPLQTWAACPLHSLTLRGIWGCCWVSTLLTWAKALACPLWRSNVPVGWMNLSLPNNRKIQVIGFLKLFFLKEE